MFSRLLGPLTRQSPSTPGVKLRDPFLLEEKKRIAATKNLIPGVEALKEQGLGWKRSGSQNRGGGDVYFDISMKLMILRGFYFAKFGE